MTKLSTLPAGVLPVRSSIAGAPLRPHTQSRERQSSARTTAIAAPERTYNVDNAEEARLHQTDAFAELKALSQRQSVNRPQKVYDRHGMPYVGHCWHLNSKK